jgi:glycerophosphoryl diester phosphodiesterase
MSVSTSFMQPRFYAKSRGFAAATMCAMTLRATVLVLASAVLGAQAARPIVIGHRGASGYRPEHTLEGYRLAAEMGADFIEPDLVPTRDGVLIARHENEIGGTTDVADRFPSRKTTKTIDGKAVTGWFTEDFTLAEIKTLRARERLAVRSHEYDGRFQIPTFDEVLDLARDLGRELGRPVGVYPETKHPTYFRGIGLPIEARLLASLRAHGWDTRDAPVFIQSFERGNLQALRAETRVRLIYLVSDPALVAGDLKDIAAFADGIGPDTRLIVPVHPDGSLGEPTDLVARAHAAGLLVHPWTVRIEPQFLPAGYHGDAGAVFEQLRALGVDGVFTDFPDLAVKAYAGR